MPELDINIQTLKDGYAIVKASGQATTNNASTFCLKLKEALKETAWVILDLSDLKYICSASMGCLMASVNRARQAGGRIITLGVSDSVRRVFDAIKFSEIAEITHSPIETVPEAEKVIMEYMKGQKNN